MTAVVAAENVAKRYGETVALDGVSLSVDAGEVLGLIGPNGAGKTTLVRAVLGATDAEGSVALFGEDPRSVDRSRLGLLPQSFSPPARLTAHETLEYYGGLYDESRRVEAVLEDVGLTDSADTHYENLSGGQQRRVCVGATLINDPDLLVLDEPTTGIDPAGRRAVWSLLESLADGGTTVLLTTHSMAEAQRLADRVGLLADGELVALSSPSELIDEYGGQTRLEVGVDGTLPERIEIDHDYRRYDGRIVVRDVAPVDIGDVVDALAAAGVAVGSLSWREPDLEDVYLELTGRAVDHAGEAVDPGEVAVAGPTGGER
ncbi:ATP-binding cassette domain-containing protein [Halapricum sp. CBA1109]|uniref:ABC transporter ATP-binding protein n=1 Tax=Halapricum sp. CBA1109 TaxID=2668068 RepID=UPI0012FB44AA|nr:ABC transporter ATP-binding protein [Halapricum sp. CBA1109]MUV89707.1 ATP-binding cassette domain-containing protein [Halapricum sp. CBA1109]